MALTAAHERLLPPVPSQRSTRESLSTVADVFV
jgi:hypothetical protein